MSISTSTDRGTQVLGDVHDTADTGEPAPDLRQSEVPADEADVGVARIDLPRADGRSFDAVPTE